MRVNDDKSGILRAGTLRDQRRDALEAELASVLVAARDQQQRRLKSLGADMEALGLEWILGRPIA